MTKAAAWTSATLVAAGILTAWRGSDAEHFLHAATLAAGSAWLFCAAAARQMDSPHWMGTLPLGCGAWAVVQLFCGWTVSPYETWNAAGAWFARAIVFTLAYAGFRDPARRNACISAIVWFGGVYALLGLFGWYAGNGSILWVFQSEYTSAIDVGVQRLLLCRDGHICRPYATAIPCRRKVGHCTEEH